MNAIQENKISMYYKVRTFFTTNLTALAVNAPVLDDQVTNFNVALLSLGSFETIATEDITGYALQKQNNRTTMRDLAITVAGALRSLAAVNKDDALKRKATITRTDIDQTRDTDALFICDRLRALAAENAADLIPFGITAAKLLAFTTSVSDFREIIQVPADQRSESSAAGKMVDAEIEDIDEILLIIDGLMDAQSLDFPLLYQQYRLDRLIDDNASGTTPPDITTTVLPGEFKVVITLPYMLSRSFKAKNNSIDPIEWSLSTTPGVFSTPPTLLDPNTTSTRLSSSLAPNGDNLLFHNPSANPIAIEITILE